MIQNAALEDERLSYKARGLLAYLLSRPPGWTTSADRLAKDSPKEGRDAVLSGLKELEVIGYLHRETKSGGRGKWTHNQTVLDVPVPPSDQEVIATGLDDSVKYDAVKSCLTNKTEPNKNEENKNDPLPPSVEVSPSADPDKDFLLSLGKLDAPDHPQWMTDQTAITATESLTKIGRTLVESVQSYYAGPHYTGKPDEKQYKQWLGLEVRLHATKQPLPVRDVVRADTPATLTQAFELFWQAYPKKQKRVEALNEFTAAVKGGVAADLIITGAKRFMLAEGNKDQQYLPFPGNWLRDGRWADEYKTKSWSHTASDD